MQVWISSGNAEEGHAQVGCCSGATALASSFTPGTLPNQIQAAFREPHLLGDPRVDQQPLAEAVHETCLALLCVTQTPLYHVGTAIPRSISHIWIFK